ncbi:hypothetical protein [Nocardia jejuensis]|uniref:hypothetical protein n=1 Tax=Nocardia jejuensis TaxID=328049 RepID=UPI00082D1027|nr:hypothetical protein [Nocardia jejuensis]
MIRSTQVSVTPPVSKVGVWERDRARATEGLLDARELLRAVAGNLEGDSPLIEWARELADLHATLTTAAVSPTRRPADFDETALRNRLAAVIALIDEWAIGALPRPATARRHTHSLGEVISHLAATYAHMQWTLRHNDDPERGQHATTRFAHVQQAYSDLVDEIRSLRVQLPLGPHAPTPT